MVGFGSSNRANCRGACRGGEGGWSTPTCFLARRGLDRDRHASYSFFAALCLLSAGTSVQAEAAVIAAENTVSSLYSCSDGRLLH
jgi:hypothetical protein